MLGPRWVIPVMPKRCIIPSTATRFDPVTSLNAMGYLTVHSKTPGKAGCLIIAFGGWPDAGESASGALRYLIRKLQAKKFADIDSEDFYDFTQARPTTGFTSQGTRVVRWPANELFYGAGEDPSQSLMLFLGVEPNLKWKTFCRVILDEAVARGVNTVVNLGALLDAVPHTRSVRISGSANGPELGAALEELAINSSNYQGPTGITSAMMEACTTRGLRYAGIWGHIPHYLQAAPNYKVSHALVSSLISILNLPLKLDELDSAAAIFEQEVEKAADTDAQLGAYIQKLEQRYDDASALLRADMPKPEELVKDLEEFLRKRRQGIGEPDADP